MPIAMSRGRTCSLKANRPFSNLKPKTPSYFGDSTRRQNTQHQHRTNDCFLKPSTNPRLPHLSDLERQLLPIRQELGLGSLLGTLSTALCVTVRSPSDAKRGTMAFA